MRARAWAWWVALLAGVAGARELDPAACAPRFDVQRDKIIRTEESREMGARYLSELDVGARSECLRLCCETDACDVFVYEEKGPGSCYLFNCGPPEDFRCKFTAHSNFSSGVLALSRRLAELQDQERLAHHEQELANLRSVTSSTASTSTAAGSRPPPPPHTTHALPEQPPSGCSRYQFACRRGGECIAVYNACDGVPQCADGSDEAPELGCPPPPPPPATHATHVTHASPPPRTVKPQRESAEAGDDRDAPAEDAAAERWPHRLTQAQPQHRFNDGAAGSHIFSHKGGLLQEPEGNALGAQYPPFETPWSRRGWPLQQTGMEGAATAGERAWGGAYPRPQWPEPDPRRAWPVPQPDQESPAYMAPKTMPEIPVAYAGRQQTLRDGPKKGFELSAAPPAPPAPVAPPARPPHDHVQLDGDKTVVVSGASAEPAEAKRAGEGVAHRHYAADADEHDGLSERPPAAVLLLVLGVLLTAAMVTMLGCRARAARRRLRRGKSPFAHDADYLVNGMYL